MKPHCDHRDGSTTPVFVLQSVSVESEKYYGVEATTVSLRSIIEYPQFSFLSTDHQGMVNAIEKKNVLYFSRLYVNPADAQHHAIHVIVWLSDYMPRC